MGRERKRKRNRDEKKLSEGEGARERNREEERGLRYIKGDRSKGKNMRGKKLGKRRTPTRA